MELIQHTIARRQAAWERNPFFAVLDRRQDTRFIGEFARRLTFWPLAFQDVLRVLATTVHESSLDLIARHHAAEDRGHDLWFLHDLAAIGGRVPDANQLFRDDHEPARRAAYGVMAEAVKARTDVAKIALLLALESTGHVFFTATASHVRRIGCAGLKYFSEDHLLVEKGHAVFEQKATEMLRRFAVTDEEAREATAVVDRCFDALEAMFRDILLSMGEQAACTG